MARAKAATMDALWAAATRHADVEEGIACAGTAIETRTAKVRGRAFLFLRKEDARFKLGASIADASKPGSGCKVGKGGWCHVVLGAADAPPLGVMTPWIDESYALMAGPGGTKSASNASSKAGSKSRANSAARAAPKRRAR